MGTFGAELPEPGTVPSVLTRLTETLLSDFGGMDPGEFRDERDILAWVKGLDRSDDVNSYVVSCVQRNPGWLKLLSRRVRRSLEAGQLA